MEQQNKIKQQIKHELEHVNIQHATLEFESEDEKCKDTNSI
jgi:Co/Zn/Cd efflux system component